jgi:hypothetical protein
MLEDGKNKLAKANNEIVSSKERMIMEKFSLLYGKLTTKKKENSL